MAHANSWRTVSGRGPYTPPSYDADVDPDPTLADLEICVDRLERALRHWGRHARDCPARFVGSFMGMRFSSPTACLCGLTEALDGTLWEGTDSTNLDAALTRLEEADGVE